MAGRSSRALHAVSAMPPPRRHVRRWPVTATNGELVSQIREAIDDAYRHGRHRPGRPALVELTGASDYDVRKALAELANEQRRQPLGQPGLMDLAEPRDHHGGSQLGTAGLANNRTSAGEGVANAGDQPGEPHPDLAGSDLHPGARPAVA